MGTLNVPESSTNLVDQSWSHVLKAGYASSALNKEQNVVIQKVSNQADDNSGSYTRTLVKP